MTDTANTATIATGLAALDLYSEHLEAAMGSAGEISNILELRYLFAISGLQSQDFVLFSVAEITVQRAGTVATFVRAIWDAVTSLKQFFAKKDHQYTRFNYLGEWHSHPSFQLHPSDRDSVTMWGIVEDPEVGANFAVLLIVRMQDGELDGRAFVYLPGKKMEPATLVLEGSA